MRQLFPSHRQQLLTQQLRREERLGLIGDHALGVVVRTGGNRASSSPTSASTPSPCAPRAARTRRSRRAPRTPAPSARRSVSRDGDVDLVDREHDRRRTPRASRAATNRSPRTDRRVRLDEEAHHVDLARGSRARGRSRARPAASAACGCPGVSRNTIWVEAVVRTPRTWVRVVCGRSETIDTLRPTIWFNSVDFPTFGRPTSETNPRPEARRRRRNRVSGPVIRRDRRSRALPRPPGLRARVMITDTMRRPWTRSAQNSSPSTSRHSPSIGTCPSVLNTSPPTVSHSSWGRSASSSSFTSSIGVRPGTRNAPSAEPLDVRARARRTRR